MVLKIAHVCNEFSPLSETFIYDTILEMERQGAECHVFANDRLNQGSRPFPRTKTLSPPPAWHPLRLWSKGFTMIRGLPPSSHLTWMRRRKLGSQLQHLQPDVVHAHFGPTGVLAMPIARKLGIPLVVTFYGFDITRETELFEFKKDYRELFSSAALLIAISEHIRQRLIEQGAPPEKIHLIRLGVDPAMFPYSDPAKRFDGRTVRLLHIGRLVPKKSPVELVEAFHVAAQQMGDQLTLHLTVVGDGELMPNVKLRTAELGLESSIAIRGALPHEDVRQLLRNVHIYTQHSVTAPDGDQEGQGVTLAEAAATGLPIVSTIHDGIPELVEDGQSGHLVAEHDVEAMGERIARLARAPECWTRFGKAGRARVEHEFSLATETAKLLHLMEERRKK